MDKSWKTALPTPGHLPSSGFAVSHSELNPSELLLVACLSSFLLLDEQPHPMPTKHFPFIAVSSTLTSVTDKEIYSNPSP